MKTETRQVTVEKQVYIADDGTEFEYQDACSEYETRNIGKRLKMYGCNWSKADTVEECLYVELDTREEIDDFIKLCNYEKIPASGVRGPGIYMYVHGTYGHINSWSNIAAVIDFFRRRVSDV